MKVNETFLKVAVSAVMTAGVIAGCTTPPIKVTMDAAGEIKLNGVSKIALADFNTLPGDPFTGVSAADAETCALVKKAVASAFYTAPMYQICDFDIEKAIHDGDNTKLVKSRFDAFICGRLWWEVTPEVASRQPEKFTLSTWKNVPYKAKVKGKEVDLVAKVTTETRDVVKLVDCRARNATLMLTLSIYRVSADGNVTKIVDTYQVTNEGFTLMNGVYNSDRASIGLSESSQADKLKAASEDKGMFANASNGLENPFVEAPVKDARRDANGKLILTQKNVTMPTELQAKLTLAAAISQKLGARLAPTKTTFEIPADDIGDARVKNMLLNGAFRAAHDYSLYMLRNRLGLQICEKVADYIPELTDIADCGYAVPDSAEKFTEYNDELVKSLAKSGLSLYFFTLGTSHDAAVQLAAKAKGHDEMIKYLAKQDLDTYFYALGVSYEASQKLVEAEECYRFSFNVKPTKASALGIARVGLALGEAGRMTETRKAKKAASSDAKIK